MLVQLRVKCWVHSGILLLRLLGCHGNMVKQKLTARICLTLKQIMTFGVCLDFTERTIICLPAAQYMMEGDAYGNMHQYCISCQFVCPMSLPNTSMICLHVTDCTWVHVCVISCLFGAAFASNCAWWSINSITSVPASVCHHNDTFP